MRKEFPTSLGKEEDVDEISEGRLFRFGSTRLAVLVNMRKIYPFNIAVTGFRVNF